MPDFMRSSDIDYTTELSNHTYPQLFEELEKFSNQNICTQHPHLVFPAKWGQNKNGLPTKVLINLNTLFGAKNSKFPDFAQIGTKLNYRYPKLTHEISAHLLKSASSS